MPISLDRSDGERAVPTSCKQLALHRLACDSLACKADFSEDAGDKVGNVGAGRGDIGSTFSPPSSKERADNAPCPAKLTPPTDSSFPVLDFREEVADSLEEVDKMLRRGGRERGNAQDSSEEFVDSMAHVELLE